jgi:uncharacterized protein (DUF302 family)
MNARINKFLSAAVLASAIFVPPATAKDADENGLVKVKSSYSVDETVTRLQKDIAAKGIMYFLTVDQAKLAKQAGTDLRPSTLLIFGNPPLGTQFLTANPFSGLDWPVRLLVLQDERGEVWMAYTDFEWIARRHDIRDRGQQFRTATSVIESITSSARAR